MPSIPEYDATVKSFDIKKGFGVINLADGIAVLHANILRNAGFTDLRPGTPLRVHIQQTAIGRMVSQVLSVDDGGWGKGQVTGRDSRWGDSSQPTGSRDSRWGDTSQPTGSRVTEADDGYPDHIPNDEWDLGFSRFDEEPIVNDDTF